MRTSIASWALVFALIVPGCVSNLTPVQRMQDAANDLTTAVRFGRLDMALARVSPSHREPFTQKHALWGSAIRIVDCDLSSVRLEDKEQARISLVVSWHRVDETEMRTTRLDQRWRDHRGKWLLESEERAGGDVGLLGEATTVVRPTPARTQFETITIR